jgi:hypothetical protein
LIPIAVDEVLLYRCKVTGKNLILTVLNKIKELMLCGFFPVFTFGGKPPIEKNEKNKKNNKLDKLDKNEKSVNLVNLIKNNDVNITNSINTNIKEFEINLTKFIENYKQINSVISINTNTNTNTNINSRITFKEFVELKSLLDLSNIPYIQSNNCEADVICSALCKLKLVHACLTNDTDLLPFQCDRIIMMSQGKVIIYELKEVLSRLNLNMSQFITACSLGRNDYNKFKLPIKINEIFEKIKDLNTIDNFVDDYNKKNYNNPHYKSISNDLFTSALNIFITYPDKGVNVINEILSKNSSYFNVRTINICCMIDFIELDLRQLDQEHKIIFSLTFENINKNINASK